jgi:hypothetical protein
MLNSSAEESSPLPPIAVSLFDIGRVEEFVEEAESRWKLENRSR